MCNRTPLWLCCLILAAGVSASPLRLDFSPRKDWGAWTATQATPLRIQPCAQAPTIDGRTDDAAWQAAATVKFPRTGTYPLTEVIVSFDTSSLYVLARCTEQKDRQRVARERNRDEGAYSDDCIEMWFDAGGGGEGYYQFVVNAANSIYDAHGGATGFSPQWQHAVSSTDAGWCVEVALPLAALELEAWRSPIGFNIGRNGPGLGNRCWAGSYGDPTAGALVLSGIAETQPEQQPLVRDSRKPLEVHIERATARPGERWIEGRVQVAPAEAAGAVVRATLRDGTKELGRLEAPVTTPLGVVAADLRASGTARATLIVELLRDGKRLAQQEAQLAADPPAEPLTAATRIPVSVDPPPGAGPLTNWPVTFGVPFAAGSLWDPERVRLVADGVEVPCQREVVATWAPEGSIKWLRCDALVSSGRRYWLEGRPANAAAGPQIRLMEQDGTITLDTGAAVYTLGPGASPIHDIRMAGRTVASAEGARGLYVVDQRGRTASLSPEGEVMEVEASGPLAACVRFEGDYRTPDGEVLAHQITRLEASAGQACARVTHTLIITRDTNEVWFRDIGWELKVAPGAEPVALLAISREDATQTHQVPLDGQAAAAHVLQDQHFRFNTGTNHFAVGAVDASGKSTTRVEGEEMGDWAALQGSEATLLISCRDAARQHPKEFEVRPDRIILRLFSNRAGEELDFRAATLVQKWDLATWYENTISSRIRKPREEVIKQASALDSSAVGWAKTHELLFSPMPPGAAASAMGELSRLHSQPVYAMADPDWICASGAIGDVHPQDREHYSEAEAAIDATVRMWAAKNETFGEFGFMDYNMGPHLGYVGAYARPYRYCVNTYTLRSDLWTIYERSGERSARAFAESTNRAQMEGCMAHWDGPRGTRGLFHSADGTETRNGEVWMGMFPFYWCAYNSVHISSSSNLNMLIHDYYLTGYRRAKDGVLDYIYGVKKIWSPSAVARDDRQLARMRLLIQCYGFTWDPELRDMADAVMDVVYRPDAELGIFQTRSIYPTEERNTTYKTQVDLRGLMDGWEIMGTRRYHDVATKLARYWWQNFLGDEPLFYTNPLGISGAALYRESKDPRYLQGLSVATRYATSAHDPVSGEIASVGGAEATTFALEGIPHALAALAEAGVDRAPYAAWAGYEDFGSQTSVVVLKRGKTPVSLDVDPAPPAAGTSPGQEQAMVTDFIVTPAGRGANPAAALPYLKKESYNNHSVLIPADAPDGAYEIVPANFGQHVLVVSGKVPMVIHAPGHWRPIAQAPQVRYYFKVPADAREAQIVFEGTARLFDPKGQPWPDAEPRHGAVDLPGDLPGLWSFLPVANELVLVRNLPPFFAPESPGAYFEPAIPWQRVELPRPQTPPERTSFVAGTGGATDNQALYVSRPTLQVNLGGPHPSGDGNQFFPHRQGTVEFWFRPSWSGGDLPAPKPGTSNYNRTLLSLAVPGEQSYALSYRMAPRNRDSYLDFVFSHCLHGWMMSRCMEKPNSLQSWRRTVFNPDEWVHIAWVWGQRDGIVPQTVPYHTKPQKNVLVAELYVNGLRGQHLNHRNYQAVITGVPALLSMYDLQGAVDELRVSDVQRYTADFKPLPRGSEFKLDEHTRLLMHFNGNLDCESAGHTGESPAALK